LSLMKPLYSSPLFFSFLLRPPPISTLFPYTTLFRSLIRLPFPGQREPAVRSLLHQAVGQQRVQRPIALGGVGQPDHVQRGALDRCGAVAQHVQQQSANLPVGAGVALHPTWRGCRRVFPFPPTTSAQRTVAAPRAA